MVHTDSGCGHAEFNILAGIIHDFVERNSVRIQFFNVWNIFYKKFNPYTIRVEIVDFNFVLVAGFHSRVSEPIWLSCGNQTTLPLFQVPFKIPTRFDFFSLQCKSAK